MKTTGIIVGIALLLTACGKGKQSQESASMSCTYSLQSAQTKIEWTAFKTMARLGVKGTFTDVKLEQMVQEGSIAELLKGLKFSIPTASTSTENPDRDQKIIRYFFGVLAEPESISGEISSVSGTDSAGIASIRIRMNGMEQAVEGNYALSDTTLTLKCLLDVNKWQAQSGIDSLNLVCLDLHKGEDGVSKLWPDVGVVVESVLKKNCSGSGE